MKKLLGIFIVLVVTFGLWSYKTSQPEVSQNDIDESMENYNQDESEDRSAEILKNDYEKLVSNLKKENIEGKEWEVITNYSLAPADVINPGNAKVFFEAVNKNLPDLVSCLKKDFCGMTTRGEHDPYFDEQKTPAHQLVRRNLKVLKETLKDDSALINDVDWDFINEIAESDSVILQTEALSLLKEYGPKTEVSDLLKKTKNYYGNSKAEALENLSKGAKAQDKNAIADEIKEVFSVGDSNTVISVLEKMQIMNLNKNEMPGILKNLCRIGDDENEAHNWPIVRYHAKKLYKDFETLCN